MKRNKTSLLILVGACLTLGLAPFTPEPHLWGKLKWLAGGAVGMQLRDWADLLMHGLPWVLLITWLANKASGLNKKTLKS